MVHPFRHRTGPGHPRPQDPPTGPRPGHRGRHRRGRRRLPMLRIQRGRRGQRRVPTRRLHGAARGDIAARSQRAHGGQRQVHLRCLAAERRAAPDHLVQGRPPAGQHGPAQRTRDHQRGEGAQGDVPVRRQEVGGRDCSGCR